MKCRRTGPEPRKTRKGGPKCGIRVHSAFQSSRCAHRRNPLLTRQTERGTLRPVIPPEQRNACCVDGHSRLPSETSASCCGHARKHQWMLEFLVALTLPDTSVKPGVASHLKSGVGVAVGFRYGSLVDAGETGGIQESLG